MREDVARLDKSKLYVIWGGNFAYELAMPVLAGDVEAGSFRNYGLGWESLAPFSMDAFKGSEWKNLADRIARDRDIPFIADKSDIDLLAVYCREHLHKEMTAREEALKTFTIFHVTCSG